MQAFLSPAYIRAPPVHASQICRGDVSQTYISDKCDSFRGRLRISKWCNAHSVNSLLSTSWDFATSQGRQMSFSHKRWMHDVKCVGTFDANTQVFHSYLFPSQKDLYFRNTFTIQLKTNVTSIWRFDRSTVPSLRSARLEHDALMTD